MHGLVSTAPAERWEEGMPLGNGGLGAMVLGDARTARLIVNDDTAWSGSPASEDEPGLPDPDRARELLARVRALVAAGDHVEAGRVLRGLQHRHSQTYLPFAELEIALTDGGGPGDVRRTLDFRTATQTTDGGRGPDAVSRTTWVSRPHGVLVHEVTASRPRDLTIRAGSRLRVPRRTAGPDGVVLHLRLPADVAPAHEPVEPSVRYDDRPGASLRGALVARVLHDGTARAHDVPEDDGVAEGDGVAGAGRLVVTGATRLTLVVATATTYRGATETPRGDEWDAALDARARVDRAVAAGPAAVRRDQIADHRALYDRVELTPHAAPSPAGESTPASRDAAAPSRDETAQDTAAQDTAARLVAINDGPEAGPERDPDLVATLFHYGRYLLICSSRPGTLPANLQGIWNHELQPPWSSSYTTNINLQMNYWAAGVTNLAETEEPLFDLIRALAVTGRRTARRLYGADGWTAHHNTDAWAYSLPVGHGGNDPKWAFWPMAGLWLTRHVADHAGFAADDTLLTSLWDVLRDAAAFALDWLVRGEDGQWGTCPSTSPENEFRTADGRVASVASSSACDLDLVRDHLTLVVAEAERRGIEDPVVERARAVLPELRRPRVGRGGALAEWDGDFAQDDPHHRHLSPLVRLYPGRWEPGEPGAGEPGPEWLDAAARFLDERGDESTGWSLAWKIGLRARLRQPGAVDALLRLVFRDMETDRGGHSGGLYPNLFAAHPPFQIDGNLGFTAGLAEALLQSHRGEIELLPALPGALPAGRVRGLVARPGVEVDIAWERGERGAPRLVGATLRALHPRAAGTHRLRHGERTATVELAVGHDVEVAGHDLGPSALRVWERART
ncbi:alpha-L-fucosidase 2 [Myceligenerans xiligouense]|uniref:Alpha-L-fucosidase 2 n=1 Tax=Myceligenerans xiligouense TaxID=253184 RepID=A0A3N4ZKC4_9MICO|nr:alpha-L-fucosidase 2 [Myceligenerans xiligouense]